MNSRKNELVGMLVLAFMFLICVGAAQVGCRKNLTPAHPGQINAVDGAVYDSLIVAQASLSQASAQVSTNPQMAQFRGPLNKAITAYNTAQAAYKVYRSAGAPADQTAGLQAQIADLVAQISKLLSGLGVALK